MVKCRDNLDTKVPQFEHVPKNSQAPLSVQNGGSCKLLKKSVLLRFRHLFGWEAVAICVLHRLWDSLSPFIGRVLHGPQSRTE
jgi:hypothetical protein